MRSANKYFCLFGSTPPQVYKVLMTNLNVMLVCLFEKSKVEDNVHLHHLNSSFAVNNFRKKSTTLSLLRE